MTSDINHSNAYLEPDALAGPKRLEEMKSAMSLLARWMESTFQLPLLENPDAFYQEKERIAALLVDNHLGKLARKIRLLGGVQGLDSKAFLYDWAEIALFTSLWNGYDKLPDGQKLNLIYQSGPNITKKHLAKVKPIKGHFLVVGKEFEEEERLLRRVVYLFAREQRQYFMILDYSFNSQPFDRMYEVGHAYEGQVIRYPFLGSQRISPVDLKKAKQDAFLYDGMIARSMDAAVQSFAKGLEINPFCEPWPVIIEMTTTYHDGAWEVWDIEGHNITMAEKDINQLASFYAAGYRSPIQVVVLLSYGGIRPLSYFNGECLIPFDFKEKE